MNGRPTAFVNVRLVDPESGYDGPGALVMAEGVIADVQRSPSIDSLSPDVRVIDGGGAVLCPGLVDLRVKTGEPGAEPKETLKSAARAAAAGGVTSIVLQPDTDPAIDDPAMVDFLLRRGRDLDLVHIYAAGAATRGCEGKALAEIGLMQEAGALYVTDADRTIADSKVLQRVLNYAKGLDLWTAHRPNDLHLAKGAVATSGEMSGRLGLPAVSAMAESIGLERDLALAQITGAKLLVDQLTTADALERFDRARRRGVNAQATCSIAALSFNELDIGDYRTFHRLDPPLRCEDDRQALIEALASGLVSIVVSAHTPLPAEDKRLPFSEAAPGAVGLETFLPALLSLHHEGRAPLVDLLRAATLNPARLLGLACGRLSAGAPADLLLCDLDAPVVIDADRLVSKSKNSPFDGRRLQGQVLMTVAGGKTVFHAEP